MPPGGEENKWELSVKDGDIVIATGGDPDIMMNLSQLDVQLRHIAKKPGRKLFALFSCKSTYWHKGTIFSEQPTRITAIPAAIRTYH